MALEDFTTYDQLADPGSWLTVTTNKVDADNVSNQSDAWHGDDKGASHFVATWEHLFKVTLIASPDDGLTVCYAVSNVVDDNKFWSDNNSQAIAVQLRIATDIIAIDDAETGNDDAWDKGSSYIGVPYWITVERTSETAIQCRIYDDSARTSLVDTLAIVITTARRYRYVFPFVSHNSGAANDYSYDVEDLDLQEAAAGVPTHFMHYQRLRAG